MAAPARAPARSWLTRIAWLGTFWIAGVAAMALVAVPLRGAMRLAGLAG